MIGQLRGTVVRTGPDLVTLDIGGVGYLVYTTPETSLALTEGSEAQLFTHLIVRENILDLYGFTSAEQVSFFKLLISVSGIGPRSALGIMSLADVHTIKQATASGDTSYLTRVSGIGKKTAEKIVLELRDKIGSLGDAPGEKTQEDTEILEALEALGYSLKEAREAIKAIPTDITDNSARLREALSSLGK